MRTNILYAIFAVFITSAMFAEEGKTSEAWREIIMKERGQPDKELYKLELGCAMRVAFSGGGDGRSKVMKNHPEYKKYKKQYLNWLKSTGNELTKKWRSNTLEAKNQKYIPIIKAEYIYSAKSGDVRKRFKKQKGNRNKKLQALSKEDQECMNYLREHSSKSKAVLIKGYSGKLLTKSDIEDLHEFAMNLEMSVRCPEHLPFQLGLTSQKRGPDMKGFSVGVEAPDFMLPKFETVLKRSEYSNEDTKDYAVFFRKECLEYFFDLFNAYEPAIGKSKLKPKEYKVKVGENKNDYVRLSSFKGKKPVVLITVRNTDGWWYRFGTKDIQALYNTYKDKVEFIYVMMTYSDPTSEVIEFFGSKTGKKICIVHPWKPELLAREAKLHWMEFPHYYIPTLIDNIGGTVRNSYLSYGGDAHFNIIDIDGKIAYDSTTAMFKKINDGYNAGTLWSNLMETQLIEILNNKGKYIPNNEGLKRGEKEFLKSEREVAKFTRLPATLKNAKVISVEKNILTVKVKLVGGEREIKITTSPFTRIEELYERKTFKQISLESLKVGSKIDILLWQDSVSGKIETKIKKNKGTLRETIYTITKLENNIIENPRRITIGKVWKESRIWLSGNVSNFDSKKRKLTVDLIKMTPENFIGYKFWKEYEGNVHKEENIKMSLSIIEKWIEGKKYTFVIDDGVDIFLNGRLSNLQDIKTNDKISLFYRLERDSNPIIYPDIIRLSR